MNRFKKDFEAYKKEIEEELPEYIKKDSIRKIETAKKARDMYVD